MEGTERALARRVQVRYEKRGYGLALAIVDDIDHWDRDPGGGDGAVGNGLGPVNPGCKLEGGDGLLTVGDTGVTTLELRRGDGRPTVLVWDAAEVDWESLRAG